MTISVGTIMPQQLESVRVRVRGRVQGVGFRPTVYRMAVDMEIDGDVLNDGEGVLIRARGKIQNLRRFIESLTAEPPPLAEIASVEVVSVDEAIDAGFRILPSASTDAQTDVAPDAAICDACREEVLDPFARRYRYPFTNCTHCGPRLTIVNAIPYDRAATTMSPFALCAACATEYADVDDRRFHAEPIACHVCGPRARLIRFDGKAVSYEQHSMLDDVDAAMSLIQKGEIVAIKALGGYQLACDATHIKAVERLRQLKGRDAKPFALMARDADVVLRYCAASDCEAAVLRAPTAPIVLLDATGPDRVADAVAPGMTTLGFMLPSTPLHVLMFRRMDRPVVMTSGNVSDEPQIISDEQARRKLAAIAPYALVHDREIANRIDDSVVREMAGEIRTLRRARGFAPASLPLPPGFGETPQILAFGAELKATFCMIKDGRAVLSQHQGDLEDLATYEDYCKNLDLYRNLLAHQPDVLACDMHPEYLSTKLAHTTSREQSTPLFETQHHHAHVAACMAENGWPMEGPAVLGVALDGLGYGAGGGLWGGEFLLSTYSGFERLGTIKPVAMAGGAVAAREPWRNLYAHISAEMGWDHFDMNFADLEVHARLSEPQRKLVASMIKSRINAPLASSCGRLFDAVAAATGICFETQAYEGQAAMLLETAVCRDTLSNEDDRLAYPMSIPRLERSGLPYIEPLAMWNAIFGDLVLKTPAGVIAARFHKGLAKAIVAMVLKLADRDPEAARQPQFDTVALSGGCFQNRILFEQVVSRLEAEHFAVLTHAKVPANDGGIALGQAVIAAAGLRAHKNGIGRI